MFYEPAVGHPLKYDPFKAIVAPRPIGWISTVDASGTPNLAPYSFFNAFCSRPPLVAFSSEGFKHTARNARDTGEFVCNLATRELAEQMNLSSARATDGVNEFELAKIDTAPSRLVRPPRVAKSPAALECRVVSVSELSDIEGAATGCFLVLGQVVGVHIDESYISGGLFDGARARAVARCGYNDYVVASEFFEMIRPM